MSRRLIFPARLFVSSFFIVGISAPHGLAAATASTALSSTIGTPVTTTMKADPSLLRIKDADREELERRKKSLLQAIATQSEEKSRLLANAKQDWERARLPVTEKMLQDSQASLAQVESQLKIVQQEIDVLKGKIGAGKPAVTTHRFVADSNATTRLAAAQAIAAERHAPVKRVTLRELIGPDQAATERNLQTALTNAKQSGAVLFFDEADALFGKRSEVKDSHDRYANVEVSYLLQRLEQYDGAVVIGTHSVSALDPATLARWQVVAPGLRPTPKP